MKPLALFGQGVNAYSPAVSRQRRLNCFYDIRQDGDKYAAIVRGTPGSIRFVTLPTFPIRGWHVVGSLMYVVSGAVLYSVDKSGAITKLGVLTNMSTFVSMADNGVQLAMFDGAAGYCYTLVTGSYNQAALNSAGSFGQITDGNLPAGATTAAFLDGRVIVNKPATRQFYESGSYDVTLWTSTSGQPVYGTKENSSDVLMAVDVWNGQAVLWGDQSIEYWQDVSTSPLPLARVGGATQIWGVAAVRSIRSFNNSRIFLGKNPDGGLQVCMLSGYQPKPVSNSDIDNIIGGFSTVSDATGLTYVVDGHPMYQLNFPTAGRSFLYDAKTAMWSEAQTGLALQARHYGNMGISFNGKNYIADYQSGNIYQLRSDIYTDNGMAIKRQIVSRHISSGGNEFGVSELWLDMETGVGLQSGQGSDPQIVLQVSKDNGRTFGPEKPAGLGTVGHYESPRVIWRRLGSARDFVFQFTMTDPVKFTVLGGSVSVRQQEGVNG